MGNLVKSRIHHVSANLPAVQPGNSRKKVFLIMVAYKNQGDLNIRKLIFRDYCVTI